MLQKRCSGCKIEKPLTEFHKNRAQSMGLNPYCRLCWNSKMREYYKKDPEKFKLRSRKYRRSEKGLKKRGLPIPTRPQPEQCDICGSKKEDNKELCLDHDHKTKQFRGWLCTRCNRALGLFKDSTKVLSAAISYLEGY